MNQTSSLPPDFPEEASSSDRWVFERNLLQHGCQRPAGVDEAGRGPLAGPVVAAAVQLPIEWMREGLPEALRELDDSKKLTPSQRQRLRDFLVSHPQVRWAVGESSVELIDRINILQATHRAMNLALEQLCPAADHALVDGLPVPSLRLPQTAVVRGDGRSHSIAAASVIAKVARDHLMMELDRQYPQYGFAVHKGYGTARHLEALQRFGPCPAHRRSFAPLRLTQLDLL